VYRKETQSTNIIGCQGAAGAEDEEEEEEEKTKKTTGKAFQIGYQFSDLPIKLT
jgi:hypothetical protein